MNQSINFLEIKSKFYENFGNFCLPHTLRKIMSAPLCGLVTVWKNNWAKHCVAKTYPGVWEYTGPLFHLRVFNLGSSLFDWYVEEMHWKRSVLFCCRLFKVRKRQLRKFSSSFRNSKSANFLGGPVRKSQIRRFLCFIYNSQICLKTVLKVVFYMIFNMYVFELGHYMLYLWGEIVCLLGHAKFHLKFANHKKDWIRKPQIRKVPHLRKVQTFLCVNPA
jgi:hypothetical protein